MGTGIIIGQQVALALSSLVITPASQVDQVQPIQSSGPWRPPQWKNSPLVSITVAGTPQANGSNSGSTVYVFDAVLRSEHFQELRMTEHPVQTGANLSDHAYIQPARVVMEIGMSDAMDSYSTGMWTGNPSKSVSAYQTILDLQQSRIPVTLTTRLNTYTNMLIENIQANESDKSLHGLRATLIFRQIFMAAVTKQAVSARAQTTGSTGMGTVQAVPVSSAITTQHQLDLKFLQSFPSVPGSGDFSSNSISGLNP